jgi:hypothetical protein
MTSTFARTSPPHVATRSQADRRDLYAPIHKALRLAMGETLTRVGRMDALDAADRAQALGQLESLLSMCAAHLRHENEFVHAAIEARQPQGARRPADDHDEHLLSIEALRAEGRALRAANPAERMPIGQRLYRLFNRLGDAGHPGDEVLGRWDYGRDNR